MADRSCLRSFALWLRDVAAINLFFKARRLQVIASRIRMKGHGYDGACGRGWGRHSRRSRSGAAATRRWALVLVVASVGWPRVRGSLGGSPAVIPGLGAAGAYWAAGVGAALALLAVHLMLRRQTVVMTRGALVVTERSLLPARTWREPLSSYREIRCQVEQRPHRYGRRSWYVVRLWHPEPGKRVELARARDAAAIEEQARDCARRLGLPLVWEQRPSIIADQTSVPGADHQVRGGVRDESVRRRAGRSLSAS